MAASNTRLHIHEPPRVAPMSLRRRIDPPVIKRRAGSGIPQQELYHDAQDTPYVRRRCPRERRLGASANHGGEDKFKMMDANNDGQVSAAEHDAAVTRMFGDMDGDKDGFVTGAELDAKHAAMKTADTGEKRGMDMKSSDKIAKMDKDGDGKLSPLSTAVAQGNVRQDGRRRQRRALAHRDGRRPRQDDDQDKPGKDDWGTKDKGTWADASDHAGHDSAASSSTPPADDTGG